MMPNCFVLFHVFLNPLYSSHGLVTFLIRKKRKERTSTPTPKFPLKNKIIKEDPEPFPIGLWQFFSPNLRPSACGHFGKEGRAACSVTGALRVGFLSLTAPSPLTQEEGAFSGQEEAMTSSQGQGLPPSWEGFQGKH